MAAIRLLNNGRIYLPHSGEFSGTPNYFRLRSPKFQPKFTLKSELVSGADGIIVTNNLRYGYGLAQQVGGNFPSPNEAYIPITGTEGIDQEVTWTEGFATLITLDAKFDSTTYAPLPDDFSYFIDDWSNGVGGVSPYTDAEVSLPNAFTFGCVVRIRVFVVNVDRRYAGSRDIVSYTDVPIYLSVVGDLDQPLDDLNNREFVLDIGEVDLDVGLIQSTVILSDLPRSKEDIKPILTIEDETVAKIDYKKSVDDLVKPTANSFISPFTTTTGSYICVNGEGVSNAITSTVVNGDGTTTITCQDDIENGFFVGVPYEMRYTLGNLVMKKRSPDGRSNTTNRATKDNLNTMTVAYSDSVSFNVEVAKPNRPTRSARFVSSKSGYDTIGEINFATGEFRFHVRGKTRDTTITITDDSVFPVQLQHIEIERTVTSRSR